MRHGKKPRRYDILFVPAGEVTPTRSFHATRFRLILAGIMAFLASVAVTLAVLMYTPVAMYVPIPNPALEERYGRQIVTLQERLNSIAEDVLMLRDYNIQLRKALGDNAPRDSVARPGSTIVAEDVRPPAGSEEVAEERPVQMQNAPSDLDLAPGGLIAGSGGEIAEPEISHAVFPLLLPTQGIATQGFEPSHGHYGLDFAAPKGTPVYAATDGHVVFAGWTLDDGNMLMISHGDGYMTVYKHLQSLLQTPHAAVRRGEAIALVGSTGNTSFGPHLHFEVWKDGIPRDPDDYLVVPTRIQ